ncbi:MAG TPA: HU family DNA-binding protein [Ignavibacteria bacterium]|nr:HU family DNA-binding protein [Ignavibacteria bacterium]
MNKEQLITQMAADAKTTKVQARAALDSFIGCVKKAVKKGDRLGLVGFGSFFQSKRKARMGRNPQTGKDIKIAAKKVVRFKAGKEFSSFVNGGK